MIGTLDRQSRSRSECFGIERTASAQSCDAPKYRYGAGNAGTTEVVGHAYVCIRYLIGVGVAQLLDHLIDLTDAGCPHRVPLREQSTACVDGNVTINSGTTFMRPTATLATRHQPKVLAVDDFGD